jgi:hypothetical protein
MFRRLRHQLPRVFHLDIDQLSAPGAERMVVP